MMKTLISDQAFLSLPEEMKTQNQVIKPMLVGSLDQRHTSLISLVLVEQEKYFRFLNEVETIQAVCCHYGLMLYLTRCVVKMNCAQ